MISSGFGICGLHILSCEDSQCLHCTDNVKVCTVCNTTANYYLYMDKCILDDLIPDDKGANKDFSTGNNGTVVNCLDVKCRTCKKDYSMCNWCHEGYLRQSLTSMVCVAETSLPETQGTNRSANVAVSCSTQDCRDCKQNFELFTFCLIGYSLNMSQSLLCTNNDMIDDTYGPDLMIGKISRCRMSSCRLCKASHLLCDECITRYALENNGCTRFEDIQDFRGPNLLTIRIENCAVSNCLKCKEDHTSCSRCDLGFGLSDNRCLRIETLPAGFGLNRQTLFVQFCLDERCEDCRYDITVCSPCFGEHYFDSLNRCLFFKLIPDRWRVNLATLRVDRCTTTNFLHCKANSNNCSRCIDGFELIEQVCRIIVHELRERSTQQLVSVKKLRSRISVFSTADQVYLLIQFNIDFKLTASIYDFRIFNDGVLQFEKKGELFGFESFDATFEYKNKIPSDQLMYYSGLAKNLRVLIFDSSLEYLWIYVSSTLKFILVYIDSSGLFARFLHLSQRLQKISQLNINFGPKLDTFLTTLNEFEALSTQKVFDQNQIKYL